MANNYIDPAFQIGMMLGDAYGNMWAANAKKRQGTRADDIIDQMRNQREIQRIADLRNPPANENAGQAVANQMAQQQAAQAAGQITSLGNLNTGMQNLGVNKGIDYLGMGDQLAEQQDPYKLSVPSPLDQLKSQVGKEYAINQANKASVDAIKANQAYESTLSPYESKVANWNPDYTEDNVRKALEKAGLADDVIDKKVGEAKKDIAKRARDVLMPSIMQNLYGSYAADKDGNVVYVPPNQMSYAKAMIDLQTLQQYDPDTAKTFMSGAITPRDIYSSNEENRKYDRNMADTRANAKQQHEWKREDTLLANKLAIERTKVTAMYRQAIKNSGGTGNAGLKMSDIKTLIELGNSAIASENPALQKQGQQILAQAYSMLGGNNGGGSAFANRDPDWNNYNDAMTAAHESLNAGNSKEQVAATLKQYMGDGDLYRKVISDLGIGEKKNSNSSSDGASPKADVQATLFPKQDNDTWLRWLTNPNDHTTFLQRIGAR